MFLEFFHSDLQKETKNLKAEQPHEFIFERHFRHIYHAIASQTLIYKEF